MGRPFHQTHEFVDCVRCGVKFERTIRKCGVVKLYCERCSLNNHYERVKRRKRDKKIIVNR